MQQEIRILGLAREPEMVPQAFISACRHRLDAINLCINLSGLSADSICESLGIDKGHFSRIRQGRANFPDAKSIELMQLCGNCAPAQYEAWRLGCDLIARSKDARIRELEEELARVRAA